MEINNAFFELRELKNKKKSSITLGKTRSTYSRIEDGIITTSFSDFEKFAESLDLTLDEMIHFIAVDQDYKQFSEIINRCINTPNDFKAKSALLNYYNDQPDLEKDSKREIYIYLAITTTFFGEWKEVTPITTYSVKKILDKLLMEYFYTEYDYLIAVHLCRCLNTDDLELLIKRMYPLTHLNQRNEQTIKFANLLVTNAISIYIYTMEYELAYELILLAEKKMHIQKNYYAKILLLFNKNIVLRFLEHDTKYIEKAQHVIEIVNDIGDDSLAQAFKVELNNLMDSPDYYSNKVKIPIVTPRS